MGFRYLVLGTGMGRAIAHCLAGHSDTSTIAIGDVNTEKAREVAGYIARNFPVPCGSIRFDANDADPLRDRQGFDVVISALPARYNLNLAESAIRRGMHFCDLGGVLPVTLGMRGLNSMARKNGISVVPDCGLMPGLGVMIARKLVQDSLAQEPDRKAPRDVVIYVGGLPQKPAGPIHYQRMFSLEGLKHLCYDDAAVIRNGRAKFVPPLSGYELLKVDRLKPFSKHFDGMVEAFITAGAGLAPWSFRDLGVTSLCEKTVRWPGFIGFVQSVSPESFEEQIGPLINIPVDGDNPDLVWMRVAVKCWKAGRGDRVLESVLFATYDMQTGLSAMERTTGFTTALIARAIAAGKTVPGVWTPEEALFRSGPENLNDIIAQAGTYFPITEQQTP
jgi:lysine 6-dehydrogenase